MMKLKLSLVAAVAALTALSAWPKITLEITNPNKKKSTTQIAEIPAEEIIASEGKIFAVYDKAGKEVPMQLTHDNKLLVPVSLLGGKKVKYTIARTDKLVVSDTICYGRFFPERDDDMTWENDRSAYRAYGPRLQSKGERAYGYDIWCKSVSYPVIEQRYFDHLRRNKSFHKEWGNGLDVYSVGPTLGGGTAALLADDGSIIYPWCWKEYEVLENGPLRFQVRLTYPPVEIGADKEVVEERVITLDKGEWLNRADVTYHGLTRGRKMVKGIVVHKENPSAMAFNPQLGTVAYEDLTDNSDAGNGKIYVGIVSPHARDLKYMPFDESKGSAIGHAVAETYYRPGSTETYYFGSGWSKGGVADFDDWQNKIAERASRTPLLIKIKKQ